MSRVQLALLAGLTVVVGGLVGLERTVMPLLGEEEFGLMSRTAILSFIAAFGVAKALANLAAGTLAAGGRRRLLLAGWLLALPVGPLLAVAHSWSVIVAANVLLGASQGLAWSMTALMKIDAAPPRRRGLVVGINESAGYVGLAATAFATGALASAVAPRTLVWAGMTALAVLGAAATVLLVEETRHRVPAGAGVRTGSSGAWAQAGFVTNVKDALVWGLLPLHFAAHGASPAEIGAVAALYPAVWGVGQLGAGWLSDHVGRRPVVVAGMLLQAASLPLLLPAGLGLSLVAAAGLGAGTALVYPTAIAAVSDAAAPAGRARALGRYRFWRDLGLAAGALLAGVGADALGVETTFAVVAALTAASGFAVLAARIDKGREPVWLTAARS